MPTSYGVLRGARERVRQNAKTPRAARPGEAGFAFVGPSGLNPDGAFLASAYTNGIIHVIRPGDGAVLLEVHGQDGLCAVAFRADGTLLGVREREGVFDAVELAPASAGAPRGHFCVAFGAVCAAGGLDPPEALRMFLFSSARDALSAATRLNIVGPFAAQRVLRGLGAFLEALAGEAAALPAGAAGAASPLAGLLQASHPQLCSRLFQS